jgi:predicted membrane channel-forming protein YqfA (hemolysin III family)
MKKDVFNIKNKISNSKIIFYCMIVSIFCAVVMIIITLATENPKDYIDGILYAVRPLIFLSLMYHLSNKKNSIG